MESISARPSLSLSLHSPVVGEDAMLLAYCPCLASDSLLKCSPPTDTFIADEQIIAPMCSTTRALNGFRHHILSIALSCRDRSTGALCSSVLAIAAHHRQRSGAALAHKTGAMKGLHESLAAPLHDRSAICAEAQLATSMMLCMYDVSSRLLIHWVNMVDWGCQIFDEQEAGHFHFHLNGAKKILSNMSQRQREHPVSQFLMEWLLYYDVLSAFAHPSRTIQNELSVTSCSNLLPNSVGETHPHARAYLADMSKDSRPSRLLHRGFRKYFVHQPNAHNNN